MNKVPSSSYYFLIHKMGSTECTGKVAVGLPCAGCNTLSHRSCLVNISFPLLTAILGKHAYRRNQDVQGFTSPAPPEPLVKLPTIPSEKIMILFTSFCPASLIRNQLMINCPARARLLNNPKAISIILFIVFYVTPKAKCIYCCWPLGMHLSF